MSMRIQTEEIRHKKMLTPDEIAFIGGLQNKLIQGMKIAGKYLSEEEIAYCIKQSFDRDSLKLVIENL